MLRKLFTTEKILLSIWIAGNLLIGLFIVRDFGVSFDEPRYFQYAAQSVDAFKSWFAQSYEPEYGPANLRFYGPSYILFVELAVRILQVFITNVPTIDIWHFSYFLLFQLTGLCLYSLSKRWLTVWAAWFVMITFISQPLLWGHAFINPKDIPFMAFVTFSIYAGLKMADALQGQEPQVSLQKPWIEFRQTWVQIPLSKRRTALKLLVIGCAVLLSILVLNPVIAKVVTFFYSADATSWAGRAFNSFADQATLAPVDSYITFAQTIFRRAVFIVLGAGSIGLLGWVLALLSRTDKYRELITRRKDSKREPEGTARSIKTMFTHVYWREAFIQFLQALTSGRVIAAGILLGLTASIRVLGPLPGLIVSIYILWKNRQRAFAVLFAYFLWAALVTYSTWPFLWISPLSRYLESVNLMMNFPWPGRVLFDGQFYRPNKIPSEYLPTLMNIQFTEPILVLFYLGVLAFLRKLFVSKLSGSVLLFVLLGFTLPLAGFILLRTPLYDNFRQLLFLVPPIFVIAGYGFEAIANPLKSGHLRATLIILCSLPGIYSIVQLHPYQYIYYNSFVGGVGGAARQYELDYWRTSYRELALQVNELASPNASIFVRGAPWSYLPYNRPDIRIENKIDPNRSYDFEYAVLTSRWNSDEYSFPEAETIHTVERNGAVLSTLKQFKEK